MLNKKARVFTAPRDTISFFVGLILAAFGVLPLLSKWGIIKFTVPFIGSLTAEAMPYKKTIVIPINRINLFFIIVYTLIQTVGTRRAVSLPKDNLLNSLNLIN